MKTLETDAEIHADGSVQLLSPLPDWLKPGRRHVLLVVDTREDENIPEHIPPTATPEMLARRKEALRELRALGGLRDVVPDPMAWQHEIREDRPLPNRD